MLSCPSETYEAVKEIVKLAKELKLDLEQFFVTAPFPGTELHYTVKEGNLLVEVVEILGANDQKASNKD